jgi:hypothetical protein
MAGDRIAKHRFIASMGAFLCRLQCYWVDIRHWVGTDVDSVDLNVDVECASASFAEAWSFELSFSAGKSEAV